MDLNVAHNFYFYFSAIIHQWKILISYALVHSFSALQKFFFLSLCGYTLIRKYLLSMPTSCQNKMAQTQHLPASRKAQFVSNTIQSTDKRSVRHYRTNVPADDFKCWILGVLLIGMCRCKTGNPRITQWIKLEVTTFF